MKFITLSCLSVLLNSYLGRWFKAYWFSPIPCKGNQYSMPILNMWIVEKLLGEKVSQKTNILLVSDHNSVWILLPFYLTKEVLKLPR